MALFAVGVLLPCIVQNGWNSTQGFATGIVAEMLAVFIGAFGWRERTAKVAVISAMILLVGLVLVYLVFSAHATEMPANKMKFTE